MAEKLTGYEGIGSDWLMSKKLVICNGKRLSVYDLEDQPLMVLETTQGPIKHHGHHIMSNDEARNCVRTYLQSGFVQVTGKAVKAKT